MAERKKKGKTLPSDVLDKWTSQFYVHKKLGSPIRLTKRISAMEIICIEKRAWESLKQYVNLLATEIETMKAQFLPKAGEA